jgi:hypothetical protein
MERLLRLPLRLALMPSCCVKGIALAVKRNTSSGLTATALPLQWHCHTGQCRTGSATVPLRHCQWCHCATASGATAPRRHWHTVAVTPDPTWCHWHAATAAPGGWPSPRHRGIPLRASYTLESRRLR